MSNPSQSLPDAEFSCSLSLPSTSGSLVSCASPLGLPQSGSFYDMRTHEPAPTTERIVAEHTMFRKSKHALQDMLAEHCFKPYSEEEIDNLAEVVRCLVTRSGPGKRYKSFAGMCWIFLRSPILSTTTRSTFRRTICDRSWKAPIRNTRRWH